MKRLAYYSLFMILVSGFVHQQAWADNEDLRTYLSSYVNIVKFSKKSNFGVFFKDENRFRSKGLVYAKEFVGVYSKITPLFSIKAYSAHKDMLYTSNHKGKWMWVAEFYLHHRWKAFYINYRNGNEWHYTDGFYRNREKIELRGYLPKPNNWLYFWASEEFRIDSDQIRINMNDVWYGLGFVPKKGLSIRVFMGIESKRRHKPSWQQTWIIGLSLTTHMDFLDKTWQFSH